MRRCAEGADASAGVRDRAPRGGLCGRARVVRDEAPYRADRRDSSGANAGRSSVRRCRCRSTGPIPTVARSISRSGGVRPTASGAACCSQTPAGRVDRASSSWRTPAPSASRCAIASTSCRGIRGASAPVPPSIAPTISTSSTASTGPMSKRQPFVTTSRWRSASPTCAAATAGVCSRSCRRGRRSPTWTPSGPRWEYAPSATSASRTAPISERCTPTRTRPCAMVLDGAIDPGRSFADGTVRQAVGFDRSLDAFLAWCVTIPHCDFASSGNPITAFHKLTTSLAHETLPAEVDGEKRTLGPGEANIGIATVLYAGRGPGGWETLGKALRDAAEGNGSGLLALSDIYTGREKGGRYDDQTDAFYAIGCLDAPAPPTVAAVTRVAERGRASGARVRRVDGVARPSVHVLAREARRRGRADPRRGCASHSGDRHHRRSRDAVRVGAGLEPRPRVGPAPHLRRGRPHRVRPWRPVHRREGRRLSDLAPASRRGNALH